MKVRAVWVWASCVSLPLQACSKENNINQNTTNNYGQTVVCEGPAVDNATCEAAQQAPSGALCVYGYCRQPCTSDAQCDALVPGTICLPGPDGSGCQIPLEKQCGAGNPACSAGLACAPDGTCRVSCSPSGGECLLQGLTCVDGVCVGTATGPEPDAGQGGSGGDGGSGGTGGASGADASVDVLQDTSEDPPSPGDSSGAEDVESGPESTTLATATSGYGIAVNDTSVYWADQGTGNVMMVPVDGGQPVKIVSGGAMYVALDNSSVYWTSSDAVMKAPLGGIPDGGAATTLASSQPMPWSIFVTTDSVFWTNFGGGTVMSLPADGGAPNPIATTQDQPSGIVADSTNVYWTTYNGGTVMSAPVGGGGATTISSGEGKALGIALDSTNVYWTLPDVGLVRMKPLGGGAAKTVASSQGWPRDVRVDSENVYWVNNSGSPGAGVWKAPIAGGNPISLAADENGPWAMAIDAAAVYWTDAFAVLRVLK